MAVMMRMRMKMVTNDAPVCLSDACADELCDVVR